MFECFSAVHHKCVTKKKTNNEAGVNQSYTYRYIQIRFSKVKSNVNLYIMNEYIRNQVLPISKTPEISQ